MSTQYEIVLYGASGYTGKLTAWKLAEAGIPFIAAGRSQANLEKELALVPELKGHDYKVVEVNNSKDDLSQLFAGKKAVLNIVGPFMQLGRPVVEAALEAGCHYFDTTGEMDWVKMLREEFGQKFKAKDLILCPAFSYMWAEGNIAAEVALESPGIDTLDIVYCADSAVSQASTASFLRMCTKPQYKLVHNQLEMWPYAKGFSVNVPGEVRSLMALPWSGGGEPIWYETDERVRNCSVLVSFRNQEMFGAVIGLLERFEEEVRHLPEDQHEPTTNEWADGLTPDEPNREDPALNRCTIACYGRGDTESVTVVIRGNCPYIQTGALQADAANRVLLGKILETGFVSPAQAFGGRNLLATLASQGHLSWRVVES